MRRSETIRSGIAASNNDDVLVLRADEFLLGNRVALAALILKRQVFHCEIDAGQVSAFDRQISGSRGTAREKDGIKFLPQLVYRNIDSHIGIRSELDAFGLHEVQTPVQNTFFHFEFRNAVAQQAADTIRALKYGRLVTGKIQLRGCCQSRWTGTDNGNFLSGTHSGNRDFNPALLECTLDNRDLDLLDRDRIRIDSKNTR